MLLPLSARWVCWFNAWSTGSASLDDARDHVVADDAAHDVVGLEPDPTPLIVAWGALRSAGATGARLLLAEAGDPWGLAGPPAFNAEVLEAGEGVLLPGAGLGLVPQKVGRGVFWQVHRAEERPLDLGLPDAERALREELLRAARVLTDLDVARWRPEVAGALAELRDTRDHPLPASYPGRAQRVALLGLRCRAIAELALDDDGATLTASSAEGRRRALAGLAPAARRALVTACELPLEVAS